MVADNNNNMREEWWCLGRLTEQCTIVCALTHKHVRTWGMFIFSIVKIHFFSETDGLVRSDLRNLRIRERRI